MHVQVSLTIEISASASLAEMEQQIQEGGQQAMREALKQVIRHWEEQTPACSHCGEEQRRLEGTARRVIATCFGRVEVPRRRFRWAQVLSSQPPVGLPPRRNGQCCPARSGKACGMFLALSGGGPRAQKTQRGAH